MLRQDHMQETELSNCISSVDNLVQSSVSTWRFSGMIPAEKAHIIHYYTILYIYIYNIHIYIYIYIYILWIPHGRGPSPQLRYLGFQPRPRRPLIWCSIDIPKWYANPMAANDSNPPRRRQTWLFTQLPQVAKPPRLGPKSDCIETPK